MYKHRTPGWNSNMCSMDNGIGIDRRGMSVRYHTVEKRTWKGECAMMKYSSDINIAIDNEHLLEMDDNKTTIEYFLLLIQFDLSNGNAPP